MNLREDKEISGGIPPRASSAYVPHNVVWTPEHIRRLWHYYSQNSATQGLYFSYQAGKAVLSQVEWSVKLRKTRNVLDYGCGPGHFISELLRISRDGQKCFGLDFSRESVDEVKQKYSSHERYGGAEWVKELPSPFQDTSMDLVFALEVVEHLSDDQLQGMMREVYRLLTPGGYIVITTPNREKLEEEETLCPECGCVFHRWQHVRTWSALSLARYMGGYGFSAVRVLETNFASRFQRIMKYLLKLRPAYKRNLLYVGKKMIGAIEDVD